LSESIADDNGFIWPRLSLSDENNNVLIDKLATLNNVDRSQIRWATGW
jgi:hypothetical protein